VASQLMGINEVPAGYCQDSVLRIAVLPSFLTGCNSHSASFSTVTWTMQILQCCLPTVNLRLCYNSFSRYIPYAFPA